MNAVNSITLRREPGPFARSLTALLLRLGLGMLFLMAGTGKLQGIKAGKYPAMITQQFGEKIAFPGDVKLFADALPYAEIGVGVALIAGLFTILGAALAGGLLLVLFFGQLHLQNAAMYPAMLTYLLVDAAVLWLSPVTSNYFSLDGLLFGWFWAPKPEGEFHRSDDLKSR